MPWTVLGIAPTEDSGAIRRAYAAKLKVTRPEDDRAGFERLRAAYEFALRWARNEVAPVASPPIEPVDPQPYAPATEPTAPPVEKTMVVDAEQQSLHRAFVELHAMMSSKRGYSAEASRALDRILGSPVLENVSVEQRVQHQLAALLAASIPASDPLLERAITRFRWNRPEAELDVTPPLAAILNRRHDLQFLEALKSGNSPYAPAFRGLQRRKIPVISWMMVHFNKAGVPNEYQLLQLIRVHHSSLLSMLEPSAVAWWDEMVSRPRVSLPIILVGLVIAALGGTVAASQEGTKAGLLYVGQAGLVFTGLVLWKLYLLDWPRHLIRTRLPVPSVALLAGWLPASIALVLLSTIPAWNFVKLILAIPAICVAQWAWTVGWIGAGDSRNLLRIPFLRVLLYNILAFVCWTSLISRMSPPVQLHAAVLCALAGTALGLPIAVDVWEHRLTARQRWIWLLSTAGMTLLAATCLFMLSDREAWGPVAAALIMVAILMHRHFAAMLGRRQQEIRFGWMVAGFVGLLIIAARAEPMVPQVELILKRFGSLFLSTVLLCTLMAMWNERRGRIAPFRDDPINESFYW
jgi:hypothetical protein